MVIAIDGPAGSGKSTIARLLAQRLGLTCVNSGNLYRALTLGCLRANIDVRSEAAALDYARNAALEYDGGAVLLNGRDVTAELHSDEVDAAVAALSSIVSLRHLVNDYLRAMAARRGAVVEGRDMTTVVFPHAEHRFYLDATAEARAQRRFEQGVSGLSRDEILRNIKERDNQDRHKTEGSLRVGEGVTVLDTSDLTVEQTYEKMVQCIQCKG